MPERPLLELPLEELLEEPLELLLEELEVPERLLSDELERLVLLEDPERPLLLVPELLELLPEVLPERLTLLEEPRYNNYTSHHLIYRTESWQIIIRNACRKIYAPIYSKETRYIIH